MKGHSERQPAITLVSVELVCKFGLLAGTFGNFLRRREGTRPAKASATALTFVVMLPQRVWGVKLTNVKRVRALLPPVHTGLYPRYLGSDLTYVSPDGKSCTVAHSHRVMGASRQCHPFCALSVTAVLGRAARLEASQTVRPTRRPRMPVTPRSPRRSSHTHTHTHATQWSFKKEPIRWGFLEVLVAGLTPPSHLWLNATRVVTPPHRISGWHAVFGQW